MDESKLTPEADELINSTVSDWGGFWSVKSFDETNKTVKEVRYESKDRLYRL